VKSIGDVHAVCQVGGAGTPLVVVVVVDMVVVVVDVGRTEAAAPWALPAVSPTVITATMAPSARAGVHLLFSTT